MSLTGHMRVLLATHDDASRALLAAWLAEWGYEVLFVQNGEEAWEILRRDDAPRLVLLGTSLTGRSAADVCRGARLRPLEHYVYIAFFCDQDDAGDVQSCMEAGADDFLARPFEPYFLRLRLAAGRRVTQLQDDLIAARDSLRSRASCDALTGVWNRETVLSILGRELTRARREGSVIAALMADIDHFKRINDTYGHQAGDAVLHEVATRMGSVIRPYDAIGRYGGEEFLFVLPGCDRLRACAAAERVLETVGAEPIGLQSGPLRVTVSIGVAASGPEPVLEIDELIHAADAALYRAKRSGRNRVEVDRRHPSDDPSSDELGPTLFETAQGIVEKLRASVPRHDVEAVRHECRALRRIASTIGAKGVVHLTRTLDQRADAGHWDTALGAVEAIAWEVNRVTAQVAGAHAG